MPPGPPLPRLLQSYLSWQLLDPYSRLLNRRYGGMVTLNLIPWGRVVAVSDPDVIKEIITGPAEVFHAGEGNSIIGEVLGRRSVLVIDEDEHLETRRQLLPAFHGEAVQRHEDVVRETTLADIATWPIGKPFRTDHHMRDITLEVILRNVIGADDSPRLDDLRRTMDVITRINVYLGVMFLRPELGRFGPWRAYKRDLQHGSELLMAEIAERRRAPDLHEREDVLSVLIAGGADDDDWLRDQIVTLLEAGHETTTTALSWAMELLAHHPEIAAKARDSDDAYLDAVINEILRIRPVIPGIARRTTRPVVVGGRRFPAGVTFIPPTSIIHNDPELYPEPEVFRPERFVDQRPGTYTFLTFGGGRRRCLGAAFAVSEMRVVLRTVLDNVEWKPARKRYERPKNAHVTLVPHRGARIIRTR